jgi:hypothetical protein
MQMRMQMRMKIQKIGAAERQNHGYILGRGTKSISRDRSCGCDFFLWRADPQSAPAGPKTRIRSLRRREDSEHREKMRCGKEAEQVAYRLPTLGF